MRIKRTGSFFLYIVRISLSALAEAVTWSVNFLFHFFAKTSKIGKERMRKKQKEDKE